MYTIKETGQTFKNRQSFVNTVRYLYKDRGYDDYQKAFYDIENNIDQTPKCQFCELGCRFTGMINGYSNTCGGKVCRRLSQSYKRGLTKIENRKKRIYDLENSSERPKCRHCELPAGILDNTSGYMITCGSDECDSINRSIRSFVRQRKYDENVLLDHDKILKTELSVVDVEKLDDKFANFIKLKDPNDLVNVYLGNRSLRKYIRNNHDNFAFLRNGASRVKRITKDTRFVKLPNHGDTLFATNDGDIFYNSTIMGGEGLIEYLEEKNLNMYCELCNILVKGNGVFGKDGLEFRSNSGRVCTKCYPKVAGCRNFYINYELAREKQSITLKRKIQNGEFTPKSHYYSPGGLYSFGKHFRSSWEILFYAWYKYRDIPIEYETVRIPYVDVSGKPRVYIVDFYDVESNILFEVKPSSERFDGTLKAKTDAATEWANNRGGMFVIVDEFDLGIILERDFCKFLMKNVDEYPLATIKKSFGIEDYI